MAIRLNLETVLNKSYQESRHWADSGVFATERHSTGLLTTGRSSLLGSWSQRQNSLQKSLLFPKSKFTSPRVLKAQHGIIPIHEAPRPHPHTTQKPQTILIKNREVAKNLLLDCM